MRKSILLKNDDVAYAWRRGDAAHNGTRSLWTDGHDLFSYDLLIGTRQGGDRIVHEHKSPRHFVSMTTSRHVALAIQYTDIIIDPPEARS